MVILSKLTPKLLKAELHLKETLESEVMLEKNKKDD
jgi:hypothetical protein